MIYQQLKHQSMTVREFGIATAYSVDVRRSMDYLRQKKILGSQKYPNLTNGCEDELRRVMFNIILLRTIHNNAYLLRCWRSFQLINNIHTAHHLLSIKARQIDFFSALLFHSLLSTQDPSPSFWPVSPVATGFSFCSGSSKERAKLHR